MAEEAARRLGARYPGLQVVGTECPPFRELTAEEQDALTARIRSTRPDILFVAFGQPKGERWIDRHLAELGVPVSVKVGASLDFAAGRVRRVAAMDAEGRPGMGLPARARAHTALYTVRPQRVVHCRHGYPRPGEGGQTAAGAMFDQHPLTCPVPKR